MNRRSFIQTGALATTAASIQHGALGVQDQMYFELRKYTNRVGPHRSRLYSYLRDAAIPAWNRAGIAHVGVFNVMFGASAPTTYVLLAHQTLESMASLRKALVDDAQYQADGKEFLSASLGDPGYTRVESSLFKAFAGMPDLRVPAAAANNEERIFELRIYESHSEFAAARKIEMFNKGEIPIFYKTGLIPVFFGEALVGELLPNLTYMLTFKDLDARQAAWDAFRIHPDWKEMSADPYYKDTVSNITSVILRPLPFSQV